jgi:hypothetical protein
MQTNRPNDPRFTTISRAQSLKILEERAKSSQNKRKDRLRPKSISRKNTPVKDLRNGPHPPDVTSEDEDEPEFLKELSPKLPARIKTVVTRAKNPVVVSSDEEEEADGQMLDEVDAFFAGAETEEDSVLFKTPSNRKKSALELPVGRNYNKPATGAGLKTGVSNKPKASGKTDRTLSAVAKNKKLTEKLEAIHAANAASEEMLTEEAIRDQAAQAAEKIVMDTNIEVDKEAEAEAKTLLLEQAIADAIGQAGVSPSPKRNAKGSRGAAAEDMSGATPQDDELQVQLALIEEAKLRQQTSTQSLDDQWNRISLQQDSAQARSKPSNSSIPAPEAGDGVSHGVRNLFTDAGSGSAASKWQDELMDEVRELRVAVQAAHPRYTDPVFHYRLLCDSARYCGAGRDRYQVL